MGLSIVQNKCLKVLALKGKQKVGSLTSTEQCVCVHECKYKFCSATYDLSKTKSVATINERCTSRHRHCFFGWVQNLHLHPMVWTLYCHVKSTVEDPVLLIVDGHNTYTRNDSGCSCSSQVTVCNFCACLCTNFSFLTEQLWKLLKNTIAKRCGNLCFIINYQSVSGTYLSILEMLIWNFRVAEAQLKDLLQPDYIFFVVIYLQTIDLCSKEIKIYWKHTFTKECYSTRNSHYY